MVAVFTLLKSFHLPVYYQCIISHICRNDTSKLSLGCHLPAFEEEFSSELPTLLSIYQRVSCSAGLLHHIGLPLGAWLSALLHEHLLLFFLGYGTAPYIISSGLIYSPAYTARKVYRCIYNARAHTAYSIPASGMCAWYRSSPCRCSSLYVE